MNKYSYREIFFKVLNGLELSLAEKSFLKSFWWVYYLSSDLLISGEKQLDKILDENTKK